MKNDPLKLDLQNGFFMIASTKIFAIKCPYKMALPDSIEGVCDYTKFNELRKLYPNVEFRQWDRCTKTLFHNCLEYLKMVNKTVIL